MGLFSRTRAAVALDPNLSDLSITELCRRRDVIEAELSSRARSLAADLSTRHGGERRECKEESRTVISLDGSKVRVAWFERRDWMWQMAVASDTPRVRFPILDDVDSPDADYRWTRREQLPLPLYEAGSSAVLAMIADEERARLIQREQWDREEYEKLKAKFG